MLLVVGWGELFLKFKIPNTVLNVCHVINEVVIIDDDPVQHFICKKQISNLNYQVQIRNFYDGSEALLFLKDRNIGHLSPERSLIFLDLNMPIMDGLQFLKHYQDLNKNIRVNYHLIILTSSILSSERLNALDFSELKGYYTKPLKPETLKMILEGVYSREC